MTKQKFPSNDSNARYVDLLAPITEESPCGPDLEYDADFVMLQTAVAPKSDAQYGDFVDTPQATNWSDIERDTRALLMRSKDIRLAVILLRSRIRQAGAVGLQEGLAFLQQLLARYGESLHPLPVFEGERDAMVYANAIAALTDPEGVLGDLRDIPLPKSPGMVLHVRDIEKAYANPRPKDALAQESAARLIAEWRARREAILMALIETHQSAQDINTWCTGTLHADAPELGVLVKLLQPFAQPGANLPGEAMANANEPASANSSTAEDSPASQHGELLASATTSPATALQAMDRWSALAEIQHVRRWFEENEPSSPVVVLLRQSERMVGKRFSELAHLIPADLLAQWDQPEA